MLIEIKGVQFVNKGAELMLHAIVQQIKVLWPEADIVLAPNVNSPYKARALLGAYQKLPLQKGRFEWHSLGYSLSPRLRGWLKNRLGLVTEADIDLVLDASGFAYGDQWPASAITLLCAEIKRYAKAGKKYILLPQAFGPFSREHDKKLLAKTLPLATLVCARDEQSVQHLTALMGKSKNLVCFPDFTNLVQAVTPDYYQHGEQKVVFIPNNNMLGQHNLHSDWPSYYISVLVRLVSIVRAQGYTPVFLNHEGVQDARLCQDIVRLAGGHITIISEPDPLKVKGIIGASKALVCSRFHGCVSALAQGIPCLGTSWSHKYEQLFADYGCPEALLTPLLDSEALEQTFLKALVDVQHPERAARRSHLLEQSKALWQQVAALAS